MFLDSSVLGYVPRADERRTEVRHTVCEDAVLVIPGEDMTLPCRVLNISRDGAGIACDLIPRAGAHVRLIMSGGHVFEAVTAWHGGGQLGLRFTTTQE